MIPSEFVNRLKSIAPTRDELSRYNLPNDYITECVQTYSCKAKHNRTLDIISSDVLINLLQEYDCSSVQIGLVSFKDRVVENIDFFQIGNVELDILALNKKTLHVEVRDHDEPSHIIWKCAANSDHFLDAILICADFFARRIKDSSLDDDSKFTLNMIQACIEKAGGEKYATFYEMLME